MSNDTTIASANANLLYYRVTLIEEGSEEEIFFDCQAEDDAHAEEQAENAYPGCQVLKLDPFAKWLIYSPNEAATSDGAGFWSNEDGWVDEESAEVFTGKDRDTATLPMSLGNDALWVTFESVQKSHAMTQSPGNDDDLTHLRLVLDVSYLANGVCPADLKGRLVEMIARAVGEGLLTGSTEAETEEWNTEVVVVSSEAKSLTEDTVANWIREQVEDGNLDPERIPVLMARYALSESAQMREELAERMGLDKDPDA